jgi:tetratricopeptide (TPR) repeat protein
MFRRLLVPTLIFVLSPFAFAQFGWSTWGAVKVRVAYTDGRPCDIHLRVQLMNSASNASEAEAFSNDSGGVEFSGVQVGNYHIVVSGDGIQTTDSGMFEVDSRKSSQSVDITVRRTGESDMPRSKESYAGSVAAVDLKVPEAAKKEFARANGYIDKKQWKKAIERLNKALQICPKYAAAYNNLGVAYGRSGDRTSERQALQQAVSVNDKFAAAYVNLAKMDIVDRNFPEAETFLGKAASADPGNPQTMVLLANVQLLDQHYDEAIANCHRVHSTPRDPHPLAHYIAARALEHENHTVEAANELKTFLQEESSGPRADAVRKELASLQSHDR